MQALTFLILVLFISGVFLEHFLLIQTDRLS